MALYFHNNYRKATVLLAVGLGDNTCSPLTGGAVRKHGWWTIPYGESVQVYSGDLAAVVPFLCYFHAQGTDGTVWAGAFLTSVTTPESSPTLTLDACWGVSIPGGVTKGFRQLNTGSYSSYTVNLID
jgi:uncharacterized membrane protein